MQSWEKFNHLHNVLQYYCLPFLPNEPLSAALRLLSLNFCKSTVLQETKVRICCMYYNISGLFWKDKYAFDNFSAPAMFKPQMGSSHSRQRRRFLVKRVFSVVPVCTPCLVISLVFLVGVGRHLLHPHHGSSDAALQLIVCSVRDVFTSRNHLQHDKSPFDTRFHTCYVFFLSLIIRK